MLIFNEQAHFERLLTEGFPDKRINRRDLNILAKGWARMGCDADSIVEQLTEFCRAWCEKANLSKYEQVLDDCAKAAVTDSRVIRPATTLNFTAAELDTIATCGSTEAQRLYFMIACIMKFYQREYIYFNSRSSIKLSELCRLGKVKTPKKGQDFLLYELNMSGNIEFSPDHILKFGFPRISLETAESPALSFEASDAMIDNFIQWQKAHYTTCARCKTVIKKTGNKTKYCPECAKQVANERHAKYVRARRSSK